MISHNFLALGIGGFRVQRAKEVESFPMRWRQYVYYDEDSFTECTVKPLI